MSLFADFETVSLKKAKKASSTKDWLQEQVSDQRRILAGEKVQTSNGKSLKKSWWDQDKNIIDVRFGTYALVKGTAYKCFDKNSFVKFLDILENYEEDPQLKKIVEDKHKEITGPKGRNKSLTDL